MCACVSLQLSRKVNNGCVLVGGRNNSLMTTTRIPRLLDNGFMYNEAKFGLELADFESGLFFV